MVHCTRNFLYNFETEKSTKKKEENFQSMTNEVFLFQFNDDKVFFETYIQDFPFSIFPVFIFVKNRCPVHDDWFRQHS